MPTNNAVNNPHILFGYANTFDVKLYRSAQTLTTDGSLYRPGHALRRIMYGAGLTNCDPITGN
jgi:hypothetical protein